MHLCKCPQIFGIVLANMFTPPLIVCCFLLLQIFWVVSANISTPPFIVYCPQNWPQLLLPACPSCICNNCSKTFHKTLCNTLLGNAKIDTQNKCICQYNLVHLQQLLRNFSQNSLQYAAGKCQNKDTIQMYLSIWSCAFATIVAKLFTKLFAIRCWEMPK